MTISQFPAILQTQGDALIQALRTLTSSSEPISVEENPPLIPWA